MSGTLGKPSGAGRPGLPGASGQPRPGGRASLLTGAWSGAAGLVVIGVGIFYLGGMWDVAWHIEVGQEAFVSPPHLWLYAGIAIVLAAAVAGFARAWRRVRSLPGPGVTLAGLGAAVAVASSPIEAAWFRVYGVDVTIWSAPHLLLIGGMAVGALGALTEFALEANRLDPDRLARPWRRMGGKWRARGAEAGVYLSAGLMLAILLGTLAEYAFDVSRYQTYYHPMLQAGLSGLVLSLAARAGGRVGGATLVAAVLTLLELVVQLQMIALAGVRPQLSLILLAAPVLDVVLWRLGGRFGWLAALAGGAAFGAVLIALGWPYTTALGGVVWSPAVLAVAGPVAVAAGAIGGALGWLAGGMLRPVPPNGEADAPWDGWLGTAGRLVLVAFISLALIGIAPAVARRGVMPRLSAKASPHAAVVGLLELSPQTPVVGQPVTVKVTFTDPFLAGPAVALPFESPRTGEMLEGALRATGDQAAFQTVLTPRQAGKRRVSIFLEGESGRLVAEAWMVVYPRGATFPQDVPRSLPVVLRAEPGPDGGTPDWLQPAMYAMVVVAILVAGMVLARSLRQASRLSSRLSRVLALRPAG